MADIFISYARADRPRAEALARALTEQGWTVWWDRDIPPGRSFDEVIEEALAGARCVIVLWSRESVQSEWVKAEASEAATRRVLVPILAERAKIPLEFRRIQAATLTNWDTLPANAEWPQFSRAVAAIVGTPPKAAAPGPTRPSTPGVRPALLAAGAGLTLLLSAIVVGSMHRWPEVRSTGEAMTSDRIPASHPPAPAPAVPAHAPAIAAVVVEARPAADSGSTVSDRPAAGAVRPRPTPSTPREPVFERAAAPPPVPARLESTGTADSTAPTPAERTNPPADRADPPASPAVMPPRPAGTAASTRSGEESIFDVRLAHGVFREDRGRLTVGSGGVRYEDAGQASGAAGAFVAACGEIDRVETLTRIADRDQRTLELRLRVRSYRFMADDAATRDRIVAAIARTCRMPER